jgi:hypothetical protein
MKRSKVLESKHNLIKKIEKLEYENNILKSEKELLQYQLTRATNDLVGKDLKIKDMENGRSNDNK